MAINGIKSASETILSVQNPATALPMDEQWRSASRDIAFAATAGETVTVVGPGHLVMGNFIS